MSVWLTPIAAEDLQHWESSDPTMAQRAAHILQQLAQDSAMSRHQVTPLAIRYPQLLSVRISPEHRVVFERIGDDIVVHQCRYHY